MSRASFAAHTRYRLYDLDLPLRIPGFAIGFAVSKFKQIGVWEKMPPALKHRAKEVRGTWTGCLKLTQQDLDSVPDDAWETIAKELSVRWRYAAKSAERVCDYRCRARLTPPARCAGIA